MNKRAALLVLVLGALSLGGCATVATLDAAKPGAPLLYAGTRLNIYALNAGCCAVERFGTEAPRYPGVDLPASLLLDTLLLPFSCAAALGLNLGVSGGL